MDPSTHCLELLGDAEKKGSENGAKPFSFGGCDEIELVAAVACGALGGAIDILFVGAPNDGKPLEAWADKKVDGAVQRFARMTGWNPSSPEQDDVAHAIGFLEKSFKVNYDQRYGADVGHVFDMNTRDHHFKSLAHSPDPVGLFFSLLNQFTSTASFASEGRLITIKTDVFHPEDKGPGKVGVELYGRNFESKVFCGFVNWIGHVMSDIAGSSVTERIPGYGMGVAAPFCELMQFCRFGEFDLGNDTGDLAELATQVFQEGYDARFALALGAPVLVTDLLVKLVWAINRHFKEKRPLAECLPSKTEDSLRTMLLVGTGTLCVMDGADALIQSEGGTNAVALALRINYIAWLRLSMLVIRELGIRLGIKRDIEAMGVLNEKYAAYLAKLESLDAERFKRESLLYERFSLQLASTTLEGELNKLLLDTYEEFELDKPWSGSFDTHMSDKHATLRFN